MRLGSLQKLLELVAEKVNTLKPEQKRWVKIWFRERFEKRKEELQYRN